MYGNKACPNDCNGNGVCNSLGHCHCNPGFRPPDCIQPGMGGSNDSGPAEDPNGKYFRHFSMFFFPSLSLSSSLVLLHKNLFNTVILFKYLYLKNNFQ